MNSANVSIQVLVNGSSTVLQPPFTVATLVAARQPRPPFAVEVNKSLVRRPEYASKELCEGDVVEIVTLVGGG